MQGHNIVINNIAPAGSVCKICGNPAPWQMYCTDCGHILRFYCDEHAYLSQGDEKLEKKVIKAYNKKEFTDLDNTVKKAKQEWGNYLKVRGIL